MNNYWQRKLTAFLHDSPDKVIHIVDHENRARALAAPYGFQPEQKARKQADFAASAADRLPWPKATLADQVLCRSDFDATDKALKHPLGGSSIQFDKPFATVEEAFRISRQSHPRIANDDPRAAFITVWRFWQNWAASADQRFACLPAETRLPDHTIWNHLTVTSAFQGCFGGSLAEWFKAKQERRPPAPPPDLPAFLLFTMGPVRDFIAAARNTRDLWSGSYLISYLIGTALTEICLDFGPDHVFFPNLLNQPILDLLLKRNLWDKTKTVSGEELWKAFGYYHQRGRERLLTPGLPNRFLAVLPSAMTEHEVWQNPDEAGRRGAIRYAAHLESVIRVRLREIADSVADHLQRHEANFNRSRFDSQISRLLEIHWQVVSWPDRIEAIQEMVKHVPHDSNHHPLDSFHALLAMLDRMPKEHRDPQCFRNWKVENDGKAGPLGQVSAAWSALYTLAAWQLEAVKSTRTFPAWSWGGWEVGKTQNKDFLNGREETCLEIPATNDGRDAQQLSRKLTGGNQYVFKPGDRLGASTLVKRLWHLTWLAKEHPFVPSEGDFAMPNTHAIAAHQPFANNADEDIDSEGEHNYFAVLALDGDEMGRWVSGFKCPKLEQQLSREAKNYFRNHGNCPFLGVRRPLSPSFHLQFSELLANFSLHCVRRIVEAFDGRLIYTGGDDVLAMLPADTAITCARALRAAFQGKKELVKLVKGVVDRHATNREKWRSDRATTLFRVTHEGFVRLTPEAIPSESEAVSGLLDDPVNFPFLVPGPAADCSVGIAIAHFKNPLQDVVRAAQDAEKRAKKDVKKGGLGRSAVAVTLVKRSGETIHWGCRWESGGLDAYAQMVRALTEGVVSAKFPHRIVELVEGYLADEEGKAGRVRPVAEFASVVDEVLAREVAVVADRQRGPRYSTDKVADIQSAIGGYLRSLDSPETKVSALIGLCQTVAFIARNLPKDQAADRVPQPEPQPDHAERQPAS